MLVASLLTFRSPLSDHGTAQVMTIDTCYKLEELDIMFMVTMMCGPRYINGIIFMSKTFRGQQGVKKGIMSLDFFNDNNSENFYNWCDNMYRKVILGNEIERSIKTFRHGTSDMITAPINFQLPNENKDVVVSVRWDGGEGEGEREREKEREEEEEEEEEEGE